MFREVFDKSTVYPNFFLEEKMKADGRNVSKTVITVIEFNVGLLCLP